MQAPTHFFTGILLAKIIQVLLPNLPLFWQILLIGGLALGSHFLLDGIAFSTYTPPGQAKWDDRFWVIFHVVFVYIGAIVVGIIFFREFWWVMIFAYLPDLVDWNIMRGLFHRDPIVHPLIDKFRARCFAWLPDFRDKNWAVLIEGGLNTLLIVGIIFI